jgi:hypothetical protein
MPRPTDPTEPSHTDPHATDLERARRRRDEAAQGSPDWDAASEAVMELEADDPASFAERHGRKLFLVRPRQTS